MMAYFFLAIIFLVFIVLTITVNRKIWQSRKRKNSSAVSAEVLDEKTISKFNSIFVNASEEYISSLGNGYILNYLANGSVKRGFAVISDKRVYFRGSCFSGSGKHLVKSDEQRTVDIKDVTGSGFIYRRYLGILLALAVAIVTLAGGVVESGLGVKTFVQDLSSRKASVEYLKEEIKYFEDYDVARAYEDLEQLKYENSILDDLLEDKAPEDGSFSELKGNYKKINEEMNLREDRIDDIYDYLDYTEDGEDYLRHLDKLLERNKSRQTREFAFSIGCGALVGLTFTFLISVILIFFEYLKKRKTYFEIQYSGGRIAFDVSYYALAEIEDFQKQLRRAKDLYEEISTKVKVVSDVQKTEPVVEKAPSSTDVSEDLRKYAKLLEDGLISQEDYDAMKKKVLGI